MNNVAEDLNRTTLQKYNCFSPNAKRIITYIAD